MTTRNPTTLTALLVAACGASGTRPHDMSAAEHQAAAETLEKESRGHHGRTDPSLEGYNTCTAWGGYRESAVCWSTPTAQEAHERDSRWLHELAEKHRAAGHALVQAERDACAGLDGADRDVSPFFYRDDVVSVSALGKPGENSGPGARSGAVIRFREVKGLTPDWLERAVECHLARSAALGHTATELGYCPLAVRGARAKVLSTSSGLEVGVWADDPTNGAEIQRRAQKLLAR